MRLQTRIYGIVLIKAIGQKLLGSLGQMDGVKCGFRRILENRVARK